jgi:ABC-type nitrate/sulfonate/bicarbonate transport system substrate-binding protein
MSRTKSGILRRVEPLRVGFLPVSDCAPLVYAQESGLFANYGLDVELSRETGWAALRDKVIVGELDAAHAPAMLPFLANLGVESDPCACVSGMVLNLQGNAVTISRHLWDQGVRDPASLRAEIYRRWRKRTFTFGVVFPYSSQHVLLRQWLKSGGINPETEVRVVTIPPTQMFPTLKLGYLDGFCVGEPWTSVAVQAEVGVCVATSAELAPLHPEKVLMVRQSFSIGRADEHERMIAALLEACAFCDDPQNRPWLSELLAHPHYVNAPAECLNASLVGPFKFGEHRSDPYPDLNIFHRHDANEPTDAKASWIMGNLYELLEVESAKLPQFDRTPVLKNVFRSDIFERGKALAADRASPAALRRSEPVPIVGSSP